MKASSASTVAGSTAGGIKVIRWLLVYKQGVREIARLSECPAGRSPELPSDCREFAETPETLFRKLDEWGFDAMVIPHGTTWGFYTPPGSSWDKQLTAAQDDPDRQTLLEIYSGHGNSEEYREWREFEIGPDGEKICPAPTPSAASRWRSANSWAWSANWPTAI